LKAQAKWVAGKAVNILEHFSCFYGVREGHYMPFFLRKSGATRMAYSKPAGGML
jgi:hypothetical protein